MKRVCVLLIVLIGLCSGCGGKQKGLPPPAPRILNFPDCPAPVAPTLPPFDAAELMDSPLNMERGAVRDDMTRAYIDGLRSTIRCYTRGKVNYVTE